MVRLLPDELAHLWDLVEEGQLSWQRYELQKAELLAKEATIWREALLLPGRKDLARSLRAEFSQYVDLGDPAETRRRYWAAGPAYHREWHEQVDTEDRQSIERFYERTTTQIAGQLEWHALTEDDGPLAYVVALHFAQAHGVRHYLDFGAGTGSGGILFARHGFHVTLADISKPSLDFCRWRLANRQLQAEVINLRSARLPDRAFDMVTAMDVFEHLADPVEMVSDLVKAIKPGGFLFGRFSADGDEDPQHIVHDFEPVMARMEEVGLRKVWEDEWLWGHEAFQLAAAATTTTSSPR